jgi:hypothetical protein
VTVFIPAQYDGSAPACVYVRQDGYNGKEKAMLEALIAAKEHAGHESASSSVPAICRRR